MEQDPAIEAKLRRMAQELEQANPSIKKENQDLPVSKTQKQSIQHFVHDWKNRFVWPIALLAIPWTQFIISQVFFQGRWHLIVTPRTISGIPGIFLSAFSHASWSHLVGNTIAFAIFSWLILAKSKKDYWITLLIGWLGGGLTCWLLGLQSAHGLSGVVYTLFGYLLTIGWLEKRFVPLALSIFVMINFSTFLWGIFPLEPRVAWWGHLFGILLGVFSAYGVYREPNQRH